MENGKMGKWENERLDLTTERILYIMYDEGECIAEEL